MMIDGEWRAHSGTQALCIALEHAGHQALFVGGCVRNALLGVPVGDLDIATDARPEDVTKLAENAGFKVVPTGFDHGTVTVIAAGKPHEVTTFRQDIATDGRWAVVAFTAVLAVDAARRDFTMNALYSDRHGTVIDPLNGIGDLKARKVRFVGDARHRIREDYLRILRFFRFHAQYGDPDEGLDADGLDACADLADGLETLSKERVGAEVKKLLGVPDPAPAVAAMALSGVLSRILPGADPGALAPLVHLEAGLEPRWVRRLAVLGGGMAFGSALRLARAEVAQLRAIRDESGANLTAAALGWKLGKSDATDTILARAALLEIPLPDGWQAEILRGQSAGFPVSAADFMPDLQGAALGQRLQRLERRWLLSDLRLTKAELLD